MQVITLFFSSIFTLLLFRLALFIPSDEPGLKRSSVWNLRGICAQCQTKYLYIYAH